MAARIDITLCETLARHAAAGDTQASHQLIEHLWPHWLGLLRASPSMGSLAQSEYHVYNVAARLVAKLGVEQARALEQYQAWRATHVDQDFGDWVRIVSANAVRDYVREQLGRGQSSPDAPSLKRLLNEYALTSTIQEQGVRPPVTQDQTARELIEYAKFKLPAEQFQALASWLEGESVDEIEQKFKLSAGQARRLVRAAIAVLRRHFNGALPEIDIDDA